MRRPSGYRTEAEVDCQLTRIRIPGRKWDPAPPHGALWNLITPICAHAPKYAKK